MTEDAAPAPSVSPTTSIGRVLVTLSVGFLVSMLFAAPGLLHSGHGMGDGLMRAVTLAVGSRALQVAAAVHADAPWYEAESLLGRDQQPSSPPMLASSVNNRFNGPAFSRGVAFEVARRQPQSIQPAGKPPPALRVPTRANPLRLLVTGDSLPGYLGPILIDGASHAGPVLGRVETHNGTGLTRPDFVDWSVVAQQQVASDNPDAVVVFLGGNDFQNMVLPGGKVLIAGTAAWTREYARRAAVCMRIWAPNAAHRVYWLSMIPSRDPGWAAIDNRINLALRVAASRVHGAEYLDILGPITNHGRYADFVRQNGQFVLVREPDGVHLNVTGSQIVANEVLPVIRHEWHLPR